MSEDELRIAGAEQAILALAPFLTDEGLSEARPAARRPGGGHGPG